MRPISAADLLDIWERGMGQATLEQALVLLGLSFPLASRQALVELTIAQRDAVLFELRERLFGSQLKGLTDCPACGERLELAFDAHDLRRLNLFPREAVQAPDSAESQSSKAALSFRRAGYRIRFRQPTSADLMKTNLLTDLEQGRRLLLEACITSATYQGQVVPVNELPAKVSEAIIDHLGQAAALANLTLAATCPACGHTWEIIFDIVSYLWNEINAWAGRMLPEVHLLAATYGWREGDILAMSAWRRQRYLEMIGA